MFRFTRKPSSGRHSQIKQFNFQLMHTTLKNVEILKHFKISKTVPTCFGLQGNHRQGGTVRSNNLISN